MLTNVKLAHVKLFTDLLIYLYTSCSITHHSLIILTMSENEKLLLTLFSEDKAISYAFMRYRTSPYLMGLTKRHDDKFSSYMLRAGPC